MNPRGACLALSLAVLVGCAAPPRAPAELETQLRAIRTEQERQARQLEVIEQRVLLAEDTVRQARLANARRSVRLGGDAPREHEGVEPIPSPAYAPAASSDDDGDDAAGTAADNTQRPAVRAAGRDGAPTPGAPFVVRDERLPNAPAPPIPLTAPAPPQGAPPPRRGTQPGGTRQRGPGADLGALIEQIGAHAPAASAPGVRPSYSSSLDEGSEPGPADPLAVAAQAHIASPALGVRVSSVRDPQAAPAYDQALALARGGRCGEALEALSSFMARWPDHPFADNAVYWRGECLASQGEWRRAANEFEALLARFPVGNKVPDALYKLAVCYLRLGDEARSRVYAQRLARDYPRAEVTARLRDERLVP